MGKTDRVLEVCILKAVDELKRLYDSGEVTYREVRGAVRNVGLEEYLDYWIYQNLTGGKDD